MTKDNMTIRFAPDGFSFIDCHGASSPQLDDASSAQLDRATSAQLDRATSAQLDVTSSPQLDLATSAQLDIAPFHEVTPGPDFQQCLHEAVLNVLPESETPLNLTVQILSERVIIIPPDTDPELATSMYHATLSDLDEPEQVLLQPLTLPSGLHDVPPSGQHVSFPSGQRVTLCFGINRQLYLFLERNYGDLRFEHHLTTLLQAASASQPMAAPVSPSPRPQMSLSQPSMAAQPAPSAPASQSQPSLAAPSSPLSLLAVHATPQFLELALFRSGQLALANVYRTAQPDNRRYYVLNTWLREGLDQLHDRLLILGTGDPASQLHQDLRPFIKHINCNC